MTAEERMRRRAAEVCASVNFYGEGSICAERILALPLEGEPQGEPAPTREWNAEVTARNVADGAESADLIAPSRVRAMAIEFERLRALNRKLAKDVIALATENDRLRAENAELRRERKKMLGVGDLQLAVDKQCGKCCDTCNCCAMRDIAAMLAAKDKP